MQLKPEYLQAHLKKQLAPLYCVWGDEPLLIQQSADIIRAAAIHSGFKDRSLFTLESETTFEWESFIHTCSTFSLFSDKKLIEIVLQTNKLTDKGLSFFKSLPAILKDNADIIILIRAGSLTPAVKKSTWFTTLLNYPQGIFIAHPFLDKAQLTQWLIKQAAQKGLILEAPVLHMMSTQNEGNVLAAHQELMMLELMSHHQKENLITLAHYESIKALTQQSRFSVFDLQDAILKGDTGRIVAILSALQREEFILTLWAIAKLIRVLIQAHIHLHPSKPLPEVLKSLGVWPRSISLYTQAFHRVPYTKLTQSLQALQAVDTDFKTGHAPQAHRHLTTLCLSLANGV